VLAKANRVVTAGDYKATVRNGRRRTMPTVVLYIRQRGEAGPVRFGFIVAKTVGNAVVRNLVRRRLKSVAFDHLEGVAAGSDVVIRALPAASQVPWGILRDHVAEALTKGGKRG
jgi:ribonuclease P protein component